MTTETKYCIDCETTQSVGNFYKHIGNRDGLQSYCKTCTNDQKSDYKPKAKTISKTKESRDYEKCTLCRLSKPLSEFQWDFSKDKNTKPNTQCESCNALVASDAYNRTTHASDRLTQSHLWFLAMIEWRSLCYRHETLPPLFHRHKHPRHTPVITYLWDSPIPQNRSNRAILICHQCECLWRVDRNLTPHDPRDLEDEINEQWLSEMTTYLVEPIE